MRYFAKKYHDLPLKETIVQRLKNLYLDKVPELYDAQHDSSDDESPKEPVQTLPHKKRGRPLLVGKELDEEVQEYIIHLRKKGSAVNTEVVIAGILMSFDSESSVRLTKPWAKYLLKRMGYVKRRATTSGKENVEDSDKLNEFLLAVQNTV